jgi:hypothetical protein
MSLFQRIGVALAALGMAVVPVLVTAPPAQAWSWDPHVQVIATTYSCGISTTTGWAWYQADTGESGWARKGNSGTITFDLYRVPGYGAATLVTIKWGVANCQAARYKVIQRPAYGTQVWLGNLG